LAIEDFERLRAAIPDPRNAYLTGETPCDYVGSTSGVPQIAADLAAPPEVGRPGAEILQPFRGRAKMV
jgi:hypothetical protein